MDPATLSLLLTYGVPLLAALAGVVVKHYVPSLGSAIFPGGAKPAVPLQPALPGSPTPVLPAIIPAAPIVGNSRHPLLSRMLQSANGQGFLSELLAGAEQAIIQPAAAGQPSLGDQLAQALLSQLTQSQAATQTAPAKN